MPEDPAVLNQDFQLSGVPEPAEVGFHRAAHQRVLLDAHRQPVLREEFLKDILKAERHFTVLQEVSLRKSFPSFQSFLNLRDF